MAQPKRFTNEQIVDAYKQTGSVWAAAKLLGACGQSVWERLKRLNYATAAPHWTPEEVGELGTLAAECPIGEVARRLGRSYAGVACKVSELGIGVRFGNKQARKPKRGVGLTKSVVAKHISWLKMWNGSVKQYCIRHSIGLEEFVTAVQHYDMAFWDEYVKTHTKIPTKECPYCQRSYYPMTAKQTTCSRRCTKLLRTDLAYFGGKRRTTIGLAEGICQLCEQPKGKLSSHHIFGKENDTENDHLIALCSGCHQIVTHLGGRSGCLTPEYWENLISLVVARKEGARKPLGYHVTVDIDELNEDDLADTGLPVGGPVFCADQRTVLEHA